MSLLTQIHPNKSALLAKSWFHISPLMVVISLLVIGSPYHKYRSCGMRKFGRVPWPSKRFASSMKRIARQSLDSLIRAMSSHFGEQFGMPGKPSPLLMLRHCYNVPPIHATVVRTANDMANAVHHSHPALFNAVLTNANHKSTALRASTYLLS